MGGYTSKETGGLRLTWANYIQQTLRTRAISLVSVIDVCQVYVLVPGSKRARNGRSNP
jgi:hypothetical protein